MAGRDYSEEDRYDYEREIRRRRRSRNQLIVTLVTAILILAIAVGCFFGIKAVISIIKDNQKVEQVEEKDEEPVEEIKIEAPSED